MDSSDALSRSRYRERRLNKAKSVVTQCRQTAADALFWHSDLKRQWLQYGYPYPKRSHTPVQALAVL